MAAGIVYHNVTTSSGVTFSIACWVPNTATPDVGAIPVQLPVNSSGAEITPATAAQLTSLMALIGEVQASPTALTVLDRLKSLGTFTDGVEALIGSTNTALGTLNAQTDTLEALIAATNTALATTNAQTDTLESLIATGNGSLASLVTGMGAPGSQLVGASTSVVDSIDGPAFRTSQDTSTLLNGHTALTPKFAKIAISATGDIVALVTSKKIRVLAAKITANAAVNAKWTSGLTPTDITGLSYFAAAGDGEVLPFNPLGWFETASGEKLSLNLSASIAVGGHILYVEV